MLIPAFRCNHFSLWEGWHILTLSQQKSQIPVLVECARKDVLRALPSSSKCTAIFPAAFRMLTGVSQSPRGKPHVRRHEWLKPFLWLGKHLNSSCPDSTPRKMGLPTLAVVPLMLRWVMASPGKHWNSSYLGSLAQPFGGYRAGDLPLCGSQSLPALHPTKMILCNICCPVPELSPQTTPSAPGTLCFSALAYSF